MKKIIALVLSALMVLGCTAIAEQSSNETAEAAADEEIECCFTGSDGTAYTFRIPAAWVQVETDENDILFTAASEDGSGMAAVELDLNDLSDPNELYATLSEEYADAELIEANGYQLVRYTDTDSDAIVLAYGNTANVIAFTFTPSEYEGIDDAINIFTASFTAEAGDTAAADATENG